MTGESEGRREPLDRERIVSALRTRRIGRELHYARTTTSTMDDARRMAEDGCAHGAVALAEEQTAGRGTKGRTWVSPPGEGIHATLVVRPDARRMARLSIISAVAAARAIEDCVPLRAGLKWPNDLELGGRKAGGILIEADWGETGPRFALVGIGINVNFDPAPHAPLIDRPATSLMIETGARQSREAVLAALLNEFETAFESPDEAAVFRAWRERLTTLGRRVEIRGPSGPPLAGIAENVAADGALLLRRDDGTVERIVAGEVTLRTA